jgi:hypothetical protein
VAPIVKLSSKPMQTKWGKKMRPEFEVIEFREIGSGGESVPQISTEQVGKPVRPVTTREELDDSIPF